jgi:predicted HTH domain antitoxin
MAESGKRKSSYVPVPKADPETLKRVHVVLAVQTGQLSVARGAELLGMSRLNFQNLRNRALTAFVEALTPKLPGRPRSDPMLRELRERIEELEDHNEQLKQEAERSETLLRGLTDTIRELSAGSRLRPSTTRTKRTRRTSRTKATDDDDASRRRALTRAEDMVRMGLNRKMAARAVGRHAATLRRWQRRRDRGDPLAYRRGPGPRRPPGPLVQARVARVVRRTRGLVGADALCRIEPGVSRRQAAAIKAATIRRIERERREAATRVEVTEPGIVRGLDQLYVQTSGGLECALVLADAAIPYRTTIVPVAAYDARHVAKVLDRDFDLHGPPLVTRMDRARAHDAPEVRSVCARYGVLVLHGPPHRPQFYGQLERQNREHRAWLDAANRVQPGELPDELDRMRAVLNDSWPRRTLNWVTPDLLWQRRRIPSIDRADLRARVEDRARRLALELPPTAVRLGTHHRLAIEHELVSLGFLNLQPGGWC